MAENAQNHAMISAMQDNKAGGKRSSRLILLFALGIVWFLLDRISKAHFAAVLQSDTVLGPYAGIFQFSLVHNTGGAWGIFSNSTWLLGLFSLVVCLGLLAYTLYAANKLSGLETFGLALVISGGIGNVVDRFLLGYVIDFIDPVFIDFPVFNIADIGVTCGLFLFVLGLFLRTFREEKSLADSSTALDRDADTEGES